MQVVVDSLLTSYAAQGKGKTLLLLHGWGDSARGLAALQAQLAKRYRVIALDVPGFGGSQAPNGVWGLTDYAEFTAHFLAKIDKTDVHAVVGHSNGGAIAICGVSSGQLKPAKLVLLASAGIRGEYVGRMKALRYLTKAGKALTIPLPKSVKQQLRKKVYQTVGSDMLVAEHLQETFKKVVGDDVRVEAAKIAVPTLLIYGDQDQATPLWYGEAFHQAITGSTLRVLNGAGHFVHVDRLAEVVHSIEEFLA
ncbi:MAG TPA: alpha/beta hydrolase [Patescibacteria group bacterium]|nr:alpha/beta hydrolase [Patescibacteria group bacterium]